MLSRGSSATRKPLGSCLFSNNEIKVFEYVALRLVPRCKPEWDICHEHFLGPENCILPGICCQGSKGMGAGGDITIMAVNGMTSQMEIDFFRVLERDEIVPYF